jgi:FlaA1/EpsC-like NDP-sugar epimerase
MSNLQNRLARAFFNLPRRQKQAIMVVADLFLLPLAIWAGYAIRLGDWQPDMEHGKWLLLLAPVVSIPVFIVLGLYRAVIRYIGSRALLTVAHGALLSTLALVLCVALLHLPGIPRSLIFLYFGLTFLLVGGSRYWVRYYYYYVFKRTQDTQAVAIYGAGQSGAQLASALLRSQDYTPQFFIDDKPSLNKAMIQGLKVYSPAELDTLVAEHDITQIFLAIPSADRESRKTILSNLEHLPVHVRSIPSAADLAAGKRNVDDLLEIDVDDLLGRSAVEPDQVMIAQCLKNKKIIVTGAGGSIGSELCRQILRKNPSVLVLFESSEHALYQIERELQEIRKTQTIQTTIAAVLGSVQNQNRVEEILRQYQIDILYHAAAYKHVPLVEHNPIEGLRNNSFGTRATANAALAVGIERFVLISTDKAVRPTNVMGASKRLAELVLQALASQSDTTIFTMVRFGNVLGSSGSVVPLFRQQIQAGGPITVTHPDVIRYFMSIPEAAQLVLQAGAMATGGEVFLLDMGEPVRIVDLAKRMIKLSGEKIKTDGKDFGPGIEIQFSGLRPGEKLYEELLISAAHQTTAHPQILAAEENFLAPAQLNELFNQLDKACLQKDFVSIRHLLMKTVEGSALSELPAVLD